MSKFPFKELEESVMEEVNSIECSDRVKKRIIALISNLFTNQADDDDLSEILESLSEEFRYEAKS